jgi:hypothetical protein
LSVNWKSAPLSRIVEPSAGPLVIVIGALGLTTVDSVELLLVATGSVSFPDADALFEIVPVAVVCTVMLTEAEAVAARTPMAQETAPAEALQVP